MNVAHTLVAVSALMATAALAAQNTRAHAVPQTSSPASAGTSAAQRTSAAGGRTSRQRSVATGQTEKQQRTRAAATGNSSVSVIGEDGSTGRLKGAAGGMESAALPGIAMLHNQLGIRAGTPIQVRVQQSVDSGHARNGDSVNAVLVQPVGGLPAGAPVTLTVVAAAPAGTLGSGGVLSLQVIRVNGEQVLSQVITAEGKQARTLLPDDAPAPGTEAVFTPDQPFTLPAA